MNKLYFGDNLVILRNDIPAETVDLIYLDPPFNSKRDYNLLFKTPKGHSADAQITAFEDSWHWEQKPKRNCIESRSDAVAIAQSEVRRGGRNSGLNSD